MLKLLERAIRPPDPVEPNPNPPGVPPASVGPPDARGGDPHGFVTEGELGPNIPPPTIRPSAWSGWPSEWWTPGWGGQRQALTDTAWACINLNSSVMATMPPYLTGAPESLDAAWLANPDPDLYASWEEAAKQVFWDFHLGEAFLIATAWYATGFPARWHVVPPWAVSVDMDGGRRRYSIGQLDVSDAILHIRYQGSVDDARGHGPLEAGRTSLVAEQVLAQYAVGFAGSGGVPTSILKVNEELSADQAGALQAQWVAARTSRIGEPAVLSGGVDWQATQVNPKDAAAVELLAATRSRIAVMLGVPPLLMGLPSGGDPMTYQNVSALFDYHWRAGLRPKAQTVMGALSGWLLPRGTAVELNRDSYVQPEPYTRAQTAEIFNRIQDVAGNPVLSVAEIRAQERFDVTGTSGLGNPAAGEPAPVAAPVVPE